MLKLTIEGENLSELKANVNSLAEELNSGETPAAAASSKPPKEKKEEKPKKIVLKDIQDALVEFQDAAADKKKGRETVKELMGRFSVKSSSELPEAEYEDFLKEIAELS
jgi:hypothetical protein